MYYVLHSTYYALISMPTVLVFGTFDLLHPGHLHFLTQAKKHGDKLVVVVGRDKVVARIKGKAPVMHENDRLAMVKALGMVDAALLGHKDYQYQTLVKKLQPDTICLGYDQQETEGEIRARIGDTIKIVRLKAYKPSIYKSSHLKK